MIKAIYDRENLRLTVRGHAGSAEPGHDLVCAAASILAYTCAACVDAADVENKTLHLYPGDAEISCRAGEETAENLRREMDAVCRGFEILRRKEPRFVDFEKK